jgi:hypothetical protein
MPDNSSAYIEDIASLEEMRAALLRFQSEAQDAVRNAQREITAALDEFQQRLHDWQRQLSKRLEGLAQAKNDLARCQSFCGPHGERADCSGLAVAVRQAEQKVQEAQEAIRTAQIHIKHVGEANANFQRQAQRFNITLTSTELPRASGLLRKSITILESYISQMVPPIGRLASRAGRIGVVLGTALVIAATGGLGSATAESASPIQQDAKVIQEIVHDVYDAEEQKKENMDDIEKSLQRGQQGTV